MPDPSLCYLICTSPRSGSCLLAEALLATGLAGNPREFFNPFCEEFWRDRLVIKPRENFVSRVISSTQSENGVFGAKVMWPQFEHLLRAHLRFRRRLPPRMDFELISRALPKIRYIWLRRDDRVAQAVSYYRARTTKIWRVIDEHDHRPPPPAKDFSYEKIDECLQFIDTSEQKWNDYFLRAGITPLTVFYECLASDYQGTVRKVLTFIAGSMTKEVIVPPPRLKKQADLTSIEWIRRYKELKVTDNYESAKPIAPNEILHASFDNMDELRKGILNIALKLGSGVDKSGRPYNWMIDCRELLLTDSYLKFAAREIWRRIKEYRPDFFAGMTLAANPLTVALMLESRNDNCRVDGLLIRREPKADGLRKLIEGPEVKPGARIVILDDIVNSGDTQRQALEALAPLNANVVAVATIVNCEGTGSQLLCARNLPLIALFTLADLGVATQTESDPGRLKLEWKAGPINGRRNGIVKSTPCISNDTVFIGSDAGFLAAFSFQGRERWRYAVRDTERGIHSSPLIFGDHVFFGAYDGYLYCVNRMSGALRWESRLGQWIGSSPTVVAEQGIVCVGVEFGEAKGALVAVDLESGVTRWTFAAKQYVHGSPCHDKPRKQILFGANDFTLYCVDLRGKQRWQFVTGGEIKAKPVVDSEGRCFFGSFDGYLYALDANNGKLLWKRRCGRSVYFTPLLINDIVIVGADCFRLIAYCRQSGNVRWVTTTGSAIRGGAIEIGSSYVAVGSKDGIFYLVDLVTGRCVDRFQTGDEIASGPTYADGLLFIPSLDGYLYAFSVGPSASRADRNLSRNESSEVEGDLAGNGRDLKHFQLVRRGVDIGPLREEISNNETLWLANTARQTKIKVQRETNNIALRGADLRRNEGVNINNVHDCITTPNAAAFPRIMHLLEEFAVDRKAALQRALIVRLQPHGQVYPHIDEGEYYAIRDRYHLCITSPGGSWLSSGGEELLMQEGELWWFDNKAMHYSKNESEVWRIHVIFDLLPKQ